MNNPVCPIDFRYGREEIKEIFGEKTKLQYLLDVEAALARAHANVGNIPKKDADEISKKASLQYVKVERVKEIESEKVQTSKSLEKRMNDIENSFETA